MSRINGSTLKCAFLALSGCLLPAAAQQLGGLAGTVVGSDGKPVPDAYVVANRKFIAGTPAFTRTTMTAADGTFNLDGLPAAEYEVCVQVPAGGYLDPCHWADAPPRATIAAGKTLSDYQLSVSRGAVVSMRVNDPRRLIKANEGHTAGAHVLVGVWTSKGLFYGAPVVAEDATGREHAITVPFDTPLTFSVHSKFFRVAQPGPPVPGAVNEPAGFRVPFQQGSKEAPKRFTVDITGTSAP